MGAVYPAARAFPPDGHRAPRRSARRETARGVDYHGHVELELNPHEARVLGVLVEKAFTTPDQYPLSLNAATNGSNQKSNRDPVVDFSEAEVLVALQGLRMKHLAELLNAAARGEPMPNRVDLQAGY